MMVLREKGTRPIEVDIETTSSLYSFSMDELLELALAREEGKGAAREWGNRILRLWLFGFEKKWGWLVWWTFISVEG
jgi:hypothetical protein